MNYKAFAEPCLVQQVTKNKFVGYNLCLFEKSSPFLKKLDVSNTISTSERTSLRIALQIFIALSWLMISIM